MSLNKHTSPIAIPTELPSIMSEFNYPITTLEISVTCCDEEFAKEQAKRIAREIDDRLKYAIKMGWSYSNSKYQNLKLNGKQLSFGFYNSITDLIYFSSSPIFEPLTYYNQYESPIVESVTFQFSLDNNNNAIEIYHSYFQECLDSHKIDTLSINAQSFLLSSNGPNPFNNLVSACCGAHLEWGKSNNVD